MMYRGKFPAENYPGCWPRSRGAKGNHFLFCGCKHTRSRRCNNVDCDLLNYQRRGCAWTGKVTVAPPRGGGRGLSQTSDSFRIIVTGHERDRGSFDMVSIWKDCNFFLLRSWPTSQTRLLKRRRLVFLNEFQSFLFPFTCERIECTMRNFNFVYRRFEKWLNILPR